MTNYKFHNDLKQLSGHVYENGEFEIPAGWEKVESSPPSISGMQANVYMNKSINSIVIAYRGTESYKTGENWNDFKADGVMWIKGAIPKQYGYALSIYNHVKSAPEFKNTTITLTGHSLGGSLAQMVSASSGTPAVTFNAYGTGDILRKYFNKQDLTHLNIINYGNKYDPIFSANYKAQPGKSYVTSPKPIKGKNINVLDKYHSLQSMGALSEAKELKQGDKLPISIIEEKIENKIRNQSDNLKKNIINSASNVNKNIKNLKGGFSGFAAPINEAQKTSMPKTSNLSNSKVQEKTEHKEKTKPTSSSKKDSDKDGKWVTIKGHPVFIEDSSPVHIVKNCYVEDMLPAKIIKSSFAQDCIDLRGTIRRVLCE